MNNLQTKEILCLLLWLHESATRKDQLGELFCHPGVPTDVSRIFPSFAMLNFCYNIHIALIYLFCIEVHNQWRADLLIVIILPEIKIINVIVVCD